MDNAPQRGPSAVLESIRDAANTAYALMQGDAATFKQGYTFANAVCAACEANALVSILSVAMVAEELHDLLLEDARATEVCLEEQS